MSSIVSSDNGDPITGLFIDASCKFTVIRKKQPKFSYPRVWNGKFSKIGFSSYPKGTFSYPKKQFHTLNFFFIPLKFVSYLKKNFIPLNNNFIPCENFFCYILCFHFIPSTSISYPEHGISYQVAKFSYPTQPISYSSVSSSHFPLFSLPDSLYVYIHLQLKELVMFADASYDQITLLSLHPPPRDGCDRHWLHPHARHRTHLNRVVKHDHV
jgi:hypothetical protein